MENNNSNYCLDICPIGKKAKEHFLEINDSVIDAISDFNDWINNCKEDCDKYKEGEIIKNE